MLEQAALTQAASEIYAEGKTRWLSLAQPLLETEEVGDVLASGTPEELTRIRIRRRLNRALKRARAEERIHVEKAIQDLQEKFQAVEQKQQTFQIKQRIEAVTIVADFLIHALGYGDVDLHALCALVFLVVEYWEPR